MSKNFKELYVGSLSYDATEYDLEKLFSVSGTVTSIHLITDLKTGEFKGCGYVRMSSEAEAKDAIASLDGAMLIDRRITVSIANPQKQKTQGGGYKGKSPDPTRSGGQIRSATGSKAAGSKTAGSKPTAAKAVSSKPAAKAEPPKTVGAKPAAAKSASSKPGSAKADFSKSDPAKSGTTEPGASKPSPSKPSAAKMWFSKSGAGKGGSGKTGKK